jgi:hypothetical protein
MTRECDTDEILKQLQVLDSLRVLRENMKFPFFTEHFPELVGLDGKINEAIEKQEAELQDKMSSCGSIDADELPQETLEPLPEPEILEPFESEPTNIALEDSSEI